jgi:hypothetical protein
VAAILFQADHKKFFALKERAQKLRERIDKLTRRLSEVEGQMHKMQLDAYYYNLLIDAAVNLDVEGDDE